MGSIPVRVTRFQMLGSIGFRAFFVLRGSMQRKDTVRRVFFGLGTHRAGTERPIRLYKKHRAGTKRFQNRCPIRLLQLSAAGGVQSCRDTACRVRQFSQQRERKLASPERGDSPRGGEMPEGQRGPLSTRWAAKPLGGVLLQNRSIRTPPSLRDTSPFRGGMSFQTFCRDTACRVRCFCCKEKIVENVPPERFQNQETAAGTQGGAVLFAPPSKSFAFLTHLLRVPRSMGTGSFAVCGRRLRRLLAS